MKRKNAMLVFIISTCLLLISCGNEKHRAASLCIYTYFKHYDIEMSQQEEYIWYVRRGTNIYRVAYAGGSGRYPRPNQIAVYPLFNSDPIDLTLLELP